MAQCSRPTTCSACPSKETRAALLAPPQPPACGSSSRQQHHHQQRESSSSSSSSSSRGQKGCTCRRQRHHVLCRPARLRCACTHVAAHLRLTASPPHHHSSHRPALRHHPPCRRASSTQPDRGTHPPTRPALRGGELWHPCWPRSYIWVGAITCPPGCTNLKQKVTRSPQGVLVTSAMHCSRVVPSCSEEFSSRDLNAFHPPAPTSAKAHLHPPRPYQQPPPIPAYRHLPHWIIPHSGSIASCRSAPSPTPLLHPQPTCTHLPMPPPVPPPPHSRSRLRWGPRAHPPPPCTHLSIAVVD